MIEKHKQTRIQADAKISANREITNLKNIFNRCIEWKKFEGDNPAEKVKTTKEPKTRLRFLSHEEEARLLAAASEPLRTIVLLGIHLGLRIQAEALTLRWESVDLERPPGHGGGCIRQKRRDQDCSAESSRVGGSFTAQG